MTEQRTFSSEGKLKLTHLINEGMNVLSEMEARRGGLNDTVKAIAEELEVKPSIIKKAIKIAQKGDWDRVFNEFDDLETIVNSNAVLELEYVLTK
jgi:DNA-binding MarR family transcriptional regulator